MTTEIVVTELEEEANDPEVVVIDTGEDTSPVQEATTIGLVDRLARVEEHLTTLTNEHNTLVSTVEGLQLTDEIQQVEVEQVADAIKELAADVPEIAEDVADTTTSKPDEPPTSKENWFYRKWFSK